jgi:hypothetical protein
MVVPRMVIDQLTDSVVPNVSMFNHAVCPLSLTERPTNARTSCEEQY